MRSPCVLSCGRQGQSGYKLQCSEAGIQMRSSPDHAQFTRQGVRLRSFLSRKIYLRSADIGLRQGQIISLTGLSALSIVLWKPNVIVSSLALDFEREENRKVISM